jgi:hypothetical protein
LQRDVVLQHEKNQLDELDLMVDKTKTTMDQSLKGRWISVSWHRKSDSFDFYAYNVGVVLEVKNGVCTIDYKDDGVHFIPLKSSGWNCSTRKIPKCNHNWRMLLKKNNNGI